MTRINAFNDWLGLKITQAVGTMSCAYVFALLALVGLPGALQQGLLATIQWVAQTFIQLVMLSILMVGARLMDDLHKDRHAEIQVSIQDLHAKHDQTLDILTKDQ